MATHRTAACIAVGSELLGEDRLDSNSLTITQLLARHGVRVVEKRVIGDSEEQVAGAVSDLLDRVDIVIVTGGLGPTADDITREAVARALGRELEHDPEVEGWVRARYQAHGRAMPAVAGRMAMVVHGARPLANRKGAAPGLMISTRDRLLAALPGVPWEMADMLEREVVPEIALRTAGAERISRTLLLGGVYESDVEEAVSHLYQRFGRDHVTILAKCGVVRLVLSSEGEPTSAERRLTEMEVAFREVLEADVVGVDVGTLEEAVIGRLTSVGVTLSAAESCTGGLLSARLTDVAGASAAFLGGVVSYSNEAKENLVGVPRELLVEHGAVSEEVARAMSAGVRTRFGSDWGIGITGIAGPSGGTADKPVGLVHWSVAGPGGVAADRRVFPGDRATVRLWSVHSALDLLRRLMERSGRVGG
jgi:nicotinamide-nucleotide amidase